VDISLAVYTQREERTWEPAGRCSEQPDDNRTTVDNCDMRDECWYYSKKPSLACLSNVYRRVFGFNRWESYNKMFYVWIGQADFEHIHV